MFVYVLCSTIDYWYVLTAASDAHVSLVLLSVSVSVSLSLSLAVVCAHECTVQLVSGCCRAFLADLIAY